MPKEEWGVKRLCPHCASRFYDLNQDPMTCPVCSSSFSLESLIQGSARSVVSGKTTVNKNGIEQNDDSLDTDTGDVSMDDDLLDYDDDDDDNVSLDDIADVSTENKDDN